MPGFPQLRISLDRQGRRCAKAEIPGLYDGWLRFLSVVLRNITLNTVRYARRSQQRNLSDCQACCRISYSSEFNINAGRALFATCFHCGSFCGLVNSTFRLLSLFQFRKRMTTKKLPIHFEASKVALGLASCGTARQEAAWGI